VASGVATQALTPTMEQTMTEADDNPTALIGRIEELLKSPTADEARLRRALSLAAEAARTPAGQRRHELLRDARELMRQSLEGGQ
jgi:hypothetical protein